MSNHRWGVRIFFQAILVAVACAGIAWYHLASIEPTLWARRARPIAVVLASLFSALVIGAIALLPVLPGRAVVGVCIAWFALVALPGFLGWITRGPRDLQGDRARAMKLMTLALDAVAMSDAAQWQEMMGALGRIEDPEAKPFAEAARQYAAEAASGAPPRAETITRFRTEGQLYLAGRKKRHRVTNSIAIALAAIIGFAPAIVLARPSACDVAESLLASERRTLATADPNAEPNGPALLVPGGGYQSVGAGTMNVVEAASTRYDPETLHQLEAAHYLQGYWAAWVHESGTKLGADVFVFAHQSGALDYQVAVTRYACRYATEAFRIPGGGVGLRIRYGSGDPIRDQAAWVVGPARTIIAVGYTAPPADHHQLLHLVEQLR
jgi:hypothetical protein